MRLMKLLIVLVFSAFLFVGCADKQLIIKRELVYIKIPPQILEIDKIQRPIIKSEKDIINAYLDLFSNYLILVDKLQAVKKLNDEVAE